MSIELRDLARDIAIEAGALAARRRAEGVEVAASKSSPVDIVTAADRETEELIRRRILEARPDDGILGEEGGTTGGTSGLTWVVDPIDGTVNYLYGIPHYAVSIAVVEGEPDPLTWDAVAAAVHNPASGETFDAARGEGARLGGEPIAVRAPVELSQALLATGFAYSAETRGRQGEVVARLLPQVRDLRRPGTASLDLSFLACGRLDAYYERTLSPWDHAAGVLIAREAGALVLGKDGAAPDRQLCIAAHPELAVVLERAVREAGALDWDV
ncbi:inositol monophosphatase family protein [Homoserinibacter sp. YIM 151385]|uniref:inositol monophosphatase family protein n=1 Tax=Homoserinibacter sp. YIM 151385 TaxID=2985506 RepID=UPI0022F04B2C|nr:inositol monophosphatase family protein [Homoserinibacter sp. YIM 151385]WBU36979.1 inositol monophosphatase family protein [Homoserinibacter sp. YIM 151385]